MTADIHQHKILILDFGSQYSQLIARRVRELGVYCELYPFDMKAEDIKQFAPKGIILSGGPESVTAEATPRAAEIVFQLGCPVLGICYGMQTMAKQLGGEVIASQHREFGLATISLLAATPLFQSLSSQETVWMSHGDRVNKMPPHFSLLASSNNCEIVAMADEKRHFYGVQFHPEVTHTEHGEKILNHFLKDICRCDGAWTARHIIDDLVMRVRHQVGNEHVLLGLSGGVDSSVVAALLHRAIPDQLTCVFIDNGLLRYREAEQVVTTFKDNLKIPFIAVDASDRFLSALQGVADPEVKRKIAGAAFIDVFQEEAKKLGDVKWLAQGTIYPDVIESAAAKTGKAHVIKTHHNVGGLPEKMHLKLVEPLRELFKDEVRRIGVALGLPHDMVYRHPFPGPGLSVRILGEVTKPHADLLRLADHIFIEELRANGWYEKISQAFAVFLPVKSVAVMGDARCYDYVIALRAVETIDFMTAKVSPLPHELLQHISNRICNEVKGVSRVVYDISGKPPATIEWE